ncbi:MAG TPA: hypothetical protein VE954_06600 [Oligoflexus sp.]|uniref:hypothetical protein n=1 Tax=Oligoflexus sp. TaxID=1971216 RepID=UPI002D6503FD|nr:hypothetical protein [Oligoflexus sp.]HYX32766.1 hypothetical protein [Oligoflexus sp.]
MKNSLIIATMFAAAASSEAFAGQGGIVTIAKQKLQLNLPLSDAERSALIDQLNEIEKPRVLETESGRYVIVDGEVFKADTSSEETSPRNN